MLGIHEKLSRYSHYKIKFNTQVVLFIRLFVCVEIHVAETIRNYKIRWDEHNDVNKSSDPATHLARNNAHEFSWYVLTRAPDVH